MTVRQLLGLTLHKPWGILIARGIKRIENRTWSPEPRLQPGEWFAIHNGKKYDDRCSPMAQSLGVDVGIFLGSPPAGTEAAIVAVAQYGGVVTTSEDPWFFGPMGWVLTKVVALEPIACRGAQGLWPVPPDIADKVRAAFANARAT